MRRRGRPSAEFVGELVRALGRADADHPGGDALGHSRDGERGEG